MSTKKRGRPATGINPAVGVRLPPELLLDLDRWRARQPSISGRPEAIRRLIESGLGYYNNQPEIRARIISHEQTRAARAWLGWSQSELAKQANLSLGTVQAFERGETAPLPNNLTAMRRAFEEAGIRPVFDQVGMAAGIARCDADFGLPSDSSGSP
jgi:DNA-binding XRE family transcriptional regulator